VKLDVDFEFEVGVSERHLVSFHWDQMWGIARVCVDGVEIFRERHIFGFKKTRRYETTVGDSEAHAVVIEKSMKPVAGGYRKQKFTIYVDDVLVGEH
jgi:hypothetical protein